MYVLKFSKLALQITLYIPLSTSYIYAKCITVVVRLDLQRGLTTNVGLLHPLDIR